MPDLHGFAADIDRVVADALQLEVDAHHRRDEAQVAGAGQVYGEEAVANTVELAAGPIDRVVAKHDRISPGRVARQQAPAGVRETGLHCGGQGREFFADMRQILFQTRFVLAHADTSVESAAGRESPICTLLRAPGRSPWRG